MNRDAGVNLSWTVVVLAAVALLATGVGATYFLLRSGDMSRSDGGPSMMAPAPPAKSPVAPAARAVSDLSLPDVVVTLSRDAVDRAGITVAPVSSGGSAADLRLPGVVEPNAYRHVVVTPLVAGRVTRVLVELGEQVRQGQTLAHVFSPELAEARTRYTSARAELEAHERELQRTHKLVEIGAASRQELERIHAEHTAQTAAVQSARARLQLLGVPETALDAASGKEGSASANVPAPLAGVVTERVANIGLNVDPASKLFTVVDLSSVWVVAELYEKDFSRVRIGSSAMITTSSYPDRVLQGRVSYIDPQLSPDTRTAKVRVEVRNPGNELRLGMLADVTVAGASGDLKPVVPRTALQNVGDRQVVYLASPSEPGKFTEREVRLGQSVGEGVEVLTGLNAGDTVVTEGAFFVRAERERLGLRPQSSGSESPSSGGAATPSGPRDVQTARVTVGDQLFDPSRLTLRAGVPLHITFLRTSDKTCATEVAFPALKIKRALPLNEPVVIEFTPTKGELAFACGMDMLRGTIVAE
jgi:membrane fusion protein, heavy metal efflux system